MHTRRVPEVALLTPRRATQARWRAVYDFLAGEDVLFEHSGVQISGGDLLTWRFMNFGYEFTDPLKRPKLLREDEEDRANIQMYDHLAVQVPLQGKNVVEIGSGRGGGCDYLARYFAPRSVIGIDLSENAVTFCNSRYRVPALRFMSGDALSLPLAEHSADVVFNVESSHCYDSLEKFASEVKRVLSAGGFALLSDLRPAPEMPVLISTFEAAGFRVSGHDITANVVAALDQRSRSHLQVVENFAKSDTLRSKWRASMGDLGSLEDFLVGAGSSAYNLLCSRELVYWSFVMESLS